MARLFQCTKDHYVFFSIIFKLDQVCFTKVCYIGIFGNIIGCSRLNSLRHISGKIRIKAKNQ